MTSQQSSAKAGWALFVLVILLSVAVRLPRLDYPLWLDEAWVANVATADSWTEVFHSSRWPSLTPPLFLVSVRWVVALVGESAIRFHLPPFLLGFTGILVFAATARRVLPTAWATAATAILALSPMFVLMSQQVKHYASDCAAAALLLMAAWAYADRPDARRLAVLTIAGIAAAGLSFTAALSLPAVVTVMLLPRLFDPVRRRAAIRDAALFAAITGTIEIAIFKFLVSRGHGEVLNEFWAAGFSDPGHPLAAAAFLAGRLPRLMLHVPLPGELHTAWPWAGIALAVAGTWFGRKQWRGADPAALFIVCVFWITMGTTAALNLIGMYPLPAAFNEIRLTMYFAPANALMIVWSLRTLWLAVPLRWRKPPPIAVQALAAGVAVGLILFSWVLARKVAAKDYWGYADTRSAIALLRSKMAPGEPLYVHAYIAEPAMVQLRLAGWPDAPAVYGDTGYPCCRIGKDFRVTNKNRDSIRANLTQLFPGPRRVRVWALFNANTFGAVDKRHFDEAGETIAGFEALGYRIETDNPFANVRVVSLTPETRGGF